MYGPETVIDECTDRGIDWLIKTTDGVWNATGGRIANAASRGIRNAHMKISARPWEWEEATPERLQEAIGQLGDEVCMHQKFYCDMGIAYSNGRRTNNIGASEVVGKLRGRMTGGEYGPRMRVDKRGNIAIFDIGSLGGLNLVRIEKRKSPVKLLAHQVADVVVRNMPLGMGNEIFNLRYENPQDY